MSKAVIIYDSRSGNTEMMAKAIEEGMKAAGAEVSSKRTVNATAVDIKDVDAAVLGAPTYHHDLIASMKTFLFEMEKADLKGEGWGSFRVLWMERRIRPDDDRYNETCLRNECDRTRTENATQTRRGWFKTVPRVWEEDC
jgi:flavodoxin